MTKKRQKLIITFLLLAFSYFLLVLLLPEFGTEEVKMMIEENRLLGAVFIVAFTALTQVLSPLASSPVVIASAAIFGVVYTAILIYFGSMISAVVNFYISKRFGRELVFKLVGKSSMQKIDLFVEKFGLKTLTISRVFGFALFDLISYAAGLTSISFKNYFLITAIASIIPYGVLALAFQSLDINSYITIVIWLLFLLISGLAFTFVLLRYLRKS